MPGIGEREKLLIAVAGAPSLVLIEQEPGHAVTEERAIGGGRNGVAEEVGRTGRADIFIADIAVSAPTLAIWPGVCCALSVDFAELQRIRFVDAVVVKVKLCIDAPEVNERAAEVALEPPAVADQIAAAIGTHLKRQLITDGGVGLARTGPCGEGEKRENGVFHTVTRVTVRAVHR